MPYVVGSRAMSWERRLHRRVEEERVARNAGDSSRPGAGTLFEEGKHDGSGAWFEESELAKMYCGPALAAATSASRSRGASDARKHGCTVAQIIPAATPARFNWRTASRRRSGRGAPRLEDVRESVDESHSLVRAIRPDRHFLSSRAISGSLAFLRLVSKRKRTSG